ncbi:type I restriction enzyme R subunit [Brevibacterium sanguinis]|uniref:Type I restriction enzyme R subunit n=2 Tax=Brevibacterium TaxID=1696 RepID=A0A366IE40_9MICO|nr:MULTISPECIES: DEAD/DEAH box helicase family protein [Brevibacterium]RBP62779.1 type I restriction enzyme R subunit [Brevibacterium sanguinis]RBP69344.1 type I restriction enzyme R subunit [Brevibacterium celere]
MSNFGFIQAEWPTIFADCARAESYVFSDPRSACIYSRRGIERLVLHLYEVLDIPVPYRDDLAARINDAKFKAVTGLGIHQKLTFLRKIGNNAVHNDSPVPVDAAVKALSELYLVLIWAAFHHSRVPDDVPAGTQFDPTLARRAAPLSRAEVSKLAEKFARQDEELAAARKRLAEVTAEVSTQLADKDAEIAELKRQIQEAQSRKQSTLDSQDWKEDRTRLELIDQDLEAAGWDLDAPNVREYRISGLNTPSGVGYADYVLWGADGKPVAVLEAKRTSASVEKGRDQAERYADGLEKRFGRRPVIFYSNGDEHHIWDDAAGYPPRVVKGFYTRDELELLVQRRTTRARLDGQPVNPAVVNRGYQKQVIAQVGAAFDAKQREALLVMATGSGKTRTAIALVDQLMKANWVKRVLFLADRRALVSQATGEFTAHLPHVTTVNLLEDSKKERAAGRIFTSTYPTMMGLIDNGDDTMFGPGYFDLVIIDEAHRSVYQKYRAIFDWFDSLLLGLTATPKDEIDKNTFSLFNIEDGVPTGAYTLEDAIEDGYLVPPREFNLGTKFLDEGIHYDELDEEERSNWDALEWEDGEIPDSVHSAALNTYLFNTSTVDLVLEKLMTDGLKVESGDKLGKSIIFAQNQKHAEFIQERFDINYPSFGGKFARIITHQTDSSQDLIEKFKDPQGNPQIAISVDMLDTGIDVPEIVNLVLFKKVRSKSKFWQMIGRGTRLREDLFGPGKHKSEFYVFDFCGNFEYFNQHFDKAEPRQPRPLNHRIVAARADLLAALTGKEDLAEIRRGLAGELARFVSGVPAGSFTVRPHRRWVSDFRTAKSWTTADPTAIAEAVDHLGALPSAAIDAVEEAKRFDLLILSCQLAALDGVYLTREARTVQAVAEALLTKQNIPMVREQVALLEEITNDDWWQDVTLPMLEDARLRLRSLARLAKGRKQNPIYSDFVDELRESEPSRLPAQAPGLNLDRLRDRARAHLRAHADHLAVQKLVRNQQLTDADIDALKGILVAGGVGDDETIDEAARTADGLGLFLRSLVGLDRQAALELFGEYLDESRFSAVQIAFVQQIIDELSTNGIVERKRLFQEPYTDIYSGNVLELFPGGALATIGARLDEVKERAIPVEGLSEQSAG